MVNVYVCYAYVCPMSQLIFGLLKEMSDIPSLSKYAQIPPILEIKHIVMGQPGRDIAQEMKHLVSQSDVFVLLWSPHSYDSERTTPVVRRNISVELKQLRTIIDNIYVIPVKIGNADLNIAWNEIELSSDHPLRSSTYLPVTAEYSIDRLLREVRAIFYTILCSVTSFIKFPFHLRNLYIHNGSLQNSLSERHGGIFYQTSGKDVTYPKILMMGAKNLIDSFFATLTNPVYLSEFILPMSTADATMTYLETLNRTIGEKSQPLREKRRIIIYDFDTLMSEFSTIHERGQGQAQKFFDFNSKIDLYYFDKSMLLESVKGHYIGPIEDFAVFDGRIVIRARSQKKSVHKRSVNGKTNSQKVQVQHSFVVETYDTVEVFNIDHNPYVSKLTDILRERIDLKERGTTIQGLYNRKELIETLNTKLNLGLICDKN